MCKQLFLLARRPLPPVDHDPAFAALRVDAAYLDAPALDALRRLCPAPFVYGLSAAGNCGCYFSYEDRSAFDDACGDKAASAASAARYGDGWAPWDDGPIRDGVRSFGRYAARHADAGLALYVAWEGMAGEPLAVERTVRPSFFGGRSFGPLEENTLLHIAPPSPAR